MAGFMRIFWASRLEIFEAALFLAIAVAPGCDSHGSRPPNSPAIEPAAGPPWFVEASEEKGLSFTHDPGKLGNYFMPEIIGSGAALFDFNNDGRLDLYLIQNAGPESKSANRLFRQREDGRFEDAGAGSGLEIAGRGMGAAAGDANNDGWIDLLLTEYGQARLFWNNGDGTFTEAAREAGIDNPFWGTSACWFDYDRDGWLDLAIANYVVYSPTRPCSDQGGKRDYCGPQPFPGTVAKLFHNLGPAPPAGATGAARARPARFLDVTVPSGLGRLPGPGLGIIAADLNGDHWPDLFVANDGKPNHLLINQKDGTFKEEAVVRGVAYNAMGQAPANMGIALGDADGNGLFDLYITHLTDELHVLYAQDAPGQFTDRTALAGLAAPRWRSTGFGTLFGDFDQDGDLDLAQVNGRVKFVSGPSEPGKPFLEVYMERNQLFANEGGGRFRDVSPDNGPFCGARAVSRGLAAGDIDNDGALDLVVTAVGEKAWLFRNAAPNRGHWLLVRAVDPAAGGRDAYGAEVTVRAGGRRWTALVTTSQSYLCSSDPRAHFGLGSAGSVETVEVLWPDGARETFPGRKSDQIAILKKGEGRKD